MTPIVCSVLEHEYRILGSRNVKIKEQLYFNQIVYVISGFWYDSAEMFTVVQWCRGAVV